MKRSPLQEHQRLVARVAPYFFAACMAVVAVSLGLGASIDAVSVILALIAGAVWALAGLWSWRRNSLWASMAALFVVVIMSTRTREYLVDRYGFGGWCALVALLLAAFCGVVFANSWRSRSSNGEPRPR